MKKCSVCNQATQIKQFSIAGASARLCVHCRSCSVTDAYNDEDINDVQCHYSNEVAKEVKAAINQSTSKRLRILIWGPTPSGEESPIREKRRQIREELEKNHEVFFSEDICEGGIPANLQEAIQTKLVHIVVCVAGSTGSIGEAHELLFGLKRKAIVWFDKKGQPRFTGQGIAKILRDSGTVVEFFDEESLKCCAVRSVSEFWIRNQLVVHAYSRELEAHAKAGDPFPDLQ